MEVLKQGVSFVSEKVGQFKDRNFPIEVARMEDFARIATQTGAQQVLIQTEYFKDEVIPPGTPLGNGAYVREKVVTICSTVGAPVGKRAVHAVHHQFVGPREEMTTRLLVTAYDQKGQLQGLLPELPISVHVQGVNPEQHREVLEQATMREVTAYPQRMSRAR